MGTLAYTRRGTWRRILFLLPWLLLVAGVAGCVVREVDWRSKVETLDEVEELLTSISKAASPEAERQALHRLMQWTASKDIAVSIHAYSRLGGQSIPMAEISGKKGLETAFEIKFDIDGDHTPERTYHLCLKVPQHIWLMLAE